MIEPSTLTNGNTDARTPRFNAPPPPPVSPRATASRPAAGTDGVETHLNDKRILVVEDNVNNYTLILRLLSELGIEHCEWISSGWKVAQAAEQYSQPDLILLDINLPYEDGFDVHRRLRAHPQLAHTRIAAVTANADEACMQRAINAGFDGFIGKPLDPDRFPEQVRRLLMGSGVWEVH